MGEKRRPDEDCKACGLYKLCQTPIMEGEGSNTPTWMFIGEAPGAEEDDEGQPFIGDSGQLLREAIEEVGIDIQKCRFSNVVRCRPPKNDLKEYPNAPDYCQPKILREIRAKNPKVVVILGATALQSLLNKGGITKLHGEVLDSGIRKYVICLHPSYILRNNTETMRRKFVDAIRAAKHAATRPEKIEKKRNHTVIYDKQMLYEYVDILRKQRYVATDIEGSTLSAYSKVRPAVLGSVAFAWSKHDGVCFPIHARIGMESKIKIRPELALEAMKDVWEDPEIKFLAHYGKYDYSYPAVLHDIWLGGYNGFYYADTGLMLYANNERRGIPRGLKAVSYQVGMPNYDQPKRQYCMENPQADPERGGNLLLCPAKLLYPYNIDDCIATYRLFFKYREILKEENLWERPLLFPLMSHMWIAAIMEVNGLKIDRKRNIELEDLYARRIKKLDEKLLEMPEIRRLQRRHEDAILAKIYERVCNYKNPPPNIQAKVLEFYERAEKKINLNAAEVRRDLVFKVLKHRPISLTETKLPSIVKDDLLILNKQRPTKVLTNMIERAELVSSGSKYVNPIVNWIGSDGRTHTSYRPDGTVTGRVSSEDPNHENFPKRYKLAGELRSQFTSSGPEWVIIEMDKKQIELRLMADRSKDKVMIAEFNAGKDPHRMGASAAFEIPEEEVTKDQRNDCKAAVSFGLVYGRSAEALAADFGWPVSKGEKFKARYFAKYHGIATYLEDRERFILEHGIVHSYFGRRRHCDGYDNDREAIKNQAVREGINSPIQGDASDITWYAGRRLARWLRKNNFKSKVIIAVHDALYVDCYRPELKLVLIKMNEFLEDREAVRRRTGWRCCVPLPNDAFLGYNLGPKDEKNPQGMLELERDKKGDFVIPKPFLMRAA